jgi:hypothetical protein
MRGRFPRRFLLSVCIVSIVCTIFFLHFVGSTLNTSTVFKRPPLNHFNPITYYLRAKTFDMTREVERGKGNAGHLVHHWAI